MSCQSGSWVAWPCVDFLFQRFVPGTSWYGYAFVEFYDKASELLCKSEDRCNLGQCIDGAQCTSNVVSACTHNTETFLLNDLVEKVQEWIEGDDKTEASQKAALNHTTANKEENLDCHW